MISGAELGLEHTPRARPPLWNGTWRFPLDASVPPGAPEPGFLGPVVPEPGGPQAPRAPNGPQASPGPPGTWASRKLHLTLSGHLCAPMRGSQPSGRIITIEMVERVDFGAVFGAGIGVSWRQRLRRQSSSFRSGVKERRGKVQ